MLTSTASLDLGALGYSAVFAIADAQWPACHAVEKAVVLISMKS